MDSRALCPHITLSGVQEEYVKNRLRSSHTVLSQLEENRLGITERKLASQTFSNPSSLGLEVFCTGSGVYSTDVTITLRLSEVLKKIVQVQGTASGG